MFPTVRKKELPVNSQIKPNESAPKIKPKLIKPDVTYAQAVDSQTTLNLSLTNILTQHNNEMSELKIMLRELMEKMGSMLNIITALVSKMA